MTRADIRIETAKRRAKAAEAALSRAYEDRAPAARERRQHQCRPEYWHRQAVARHVPAREQRDAGLHIGRED